MKKYVIKKGKHSPNGIQFGLLYKPREIIKNVMFTDSCKYSFLKGKGQINKLFGVTRNIFSSPHAVSARFGWTGDTGKYTNLADDEIMLYAYVHHKGKGRTEKEIAKLKVNQIYTLSIILNEYSYIFTITQGDSLISQELVRMRVKNQPILSYKLFPYFGGVIPSPQDITIFLD